MPGPCYPVLGFSIQRARADNVLCVCVCVCVCVFSLSLLCSLGGRYNNNNKLIIINVHLFLSNAKRFNNNPIDVHVDHGGSRPMTSVLTLIPQTMCTNMCTVYILQLIQIDLVMLSFLHPPNMHLLPLYFSHSLLFFIFTFKLFSLLMCICDAFVPSLLTRTIELHCLWQVRMVIMM